MAAKKLEIITGARKQPITWARYRFVHWDILLPSFQKKHNFSEIIQDFGGAKLWQNAKYIEN